MNVLHLMPEPENAPEHNHVKQLPALAAAGKLNLEPGKAANVEVAHGDNCGLWKGRRCDCDPDIRVR